jgi:hypothetical protein
MKLPKDKALRWIVILLILLSACAPEKPTITPSVVSPLVTPEFTAAPRKGTNSDVTPSPVVTESCRRGDHLDELE